MVKPKLMPSIAAEFASANLGDKRRNKRLEHMAEALAEDPSRSLPEAMVDGAGLEGAYRFLNNAAIEPAAILAPHFKATAERAAREASVLVAHDTTEFNFGGTGKRRGLGRLRGEGSQGFFAHVSLCLSSAESHEPLGALALHTWVRGNERKGKRSSGQHRKDGSNEALRWRKSVEEAEERLPAGVRAVHIMDREGDSYVLFSDLTNRGFQFVIRAAHDRVLGDTADSLFDIAGEAPFVLQREVALSDRRAPSTPRARRLHPARRSRSASLSIHATTTMLRRSSYAPQTAPANLSINIVYVRELRPPTGEAPVEWLLLTSMPIDTSEQVAHIVDMYRKRWMIEEFFKALKSGCTFEEHQLESYDALLRALAMCLPLAWQLLVLRHLTRQRPDAPASQVLNEVQIEIVKGFARRPPSNTLTVHEAFLLIAGRGGHIKNNGEPGWLVLGRGFRRLLILEEGWRAACEAARSDQS
jgi:hypothetical protein